MRPPLFGLPFGEPARPSSGYSGQGRPRPTGQERFDLGFGIVEARRAPPTLPRPK